MTTATHLSPVEQERILARTQQLKEEMASLEKEVMAVRDQKALELRATLRCQFKYEVVKVEDMWVDIFDSLKRKRPDDPEFSKKKIKVRRTFLNRAEIWEKIVAAQCTVMNFPEEVVHSCDYFLYHNVLLHQSGGWVFFDSPMMVTNEEWEMFLRGVIPERLAPSNNVGLHISAQH